MEQLESTNQQNYNYIQNLNKEHVEKINELAKKYEKDSLILNLKVSKFDELNNKINQLNFELDNVQKEYNHNIEINNSLNKKIDELEERNNILNSNKDKFMNMCVDTKNKQIIEDF